MGDTASHEEENDGRQLKLVNRAQPLEVFVHSLGLNESSDVGRGTRIWAFSHVMSGAHIGENCNIGEGCFIESGSSMGSNVTVKNGVQIWEGVCIEDDVFVGPNVTFTNDRNPRAIIKKYGQDLLPTRICRGATIGANSTILPGITIGEHAFVAAGAVVTKDVMPYALMMGSRGRQRGWMCICGSKFSPGETCQCGRHYIQRSDGTIEMLDGNTSLSMDI